MYKYIKLRIFPYSRSQFLFKIQNLDAVFKRMRQLNGYIFGLVFQLHLRFQIKIKIKYLIYNSKLRVGHSHDGIKQKKVQCQLSRHIPLNRIFYFLIIKDALYNVKVYFFLFLQKKNQIKILSLPLFILKSSSTFKNLLSNFICY